MATIATIQHLLTKEDCQKILTRSFDVPTQLISYKITKYSENVAGFLGDHLKLTIKFANNNTTSQATYFMKTLPQFNLNQLDYVQESGIFKKEVILYQNLLTELTKIGHFSPRCYFVKDNLIVLEDLKSKGFNMNSVYRFLKDDHTVAMLKTVARYHASSLVYEKKWNLRLSDKFKDEIKEACFSFTEGQPRYKWLLSTTKCITDLIKLLPYQNDICTKFEKFIFGEMEQMLAPSKKFRNVLTHDDLWCNNLLFNDKNECLLVDYQLTRYAPPSLDFLTSLYLNLDCSYVDNNLKTLADIYYSFLVEELQRHNLDSSELTRSEFDESLQLYKLPALVETVMYGTHIYISEELANQVIANFTSYNEFSFLNRSKFAIKEFQENQQYRGRISSALKLLVEALENRS